MTEELDPRLYEELRRIAARYMRDERSTHTLQPTALVNEAFVRIADHVRAEPRDRGRLLALAARVMRNVLVDHARRKATGKRGADARRVTLSDLTVDGEAQIDLVALDECLAELARFDELKGRIVDLLFFAGLSVPEVADTLGLATRTVEKHWSLARTWLRSRLE